MTKERVYELAFNRIRNLNLWGLPSEEAAKTPPYIVGICDMASAIILELDKEECANEDN